jgi:hypothetical protein
MKSFNYETDSAIHGKDDNQSLKMHIGFKYIDTLDFLQMDIDEEWKHKFNHKFGTENRYYRGQRKFVLVRDSFFVCSNILKFDYKNQEDTIYFISEEKTAGIIKSIQVRNKK